MGLAEVLWLIPDPGIDFGAFYASAGEWVRGSAPYPMRGIEPPNLTPPVMLLVFAPFTHLPLAAARVLWDVGSLVCISASVWLARRDIGMMPRDVLVIVLAASPTLLGLGLGQVSGLLMLVMTLAWIAMRRRRPAAGGAWIGVVCLLKPFYGLFLVWLLWKREWRAAWALVAVVAGGLLASLLVVGIAGVQMWVTLMQRITWQAHLYNASINGVGARLFSTATDLPAATWTPMLISDPARLATQLALMLLVALLTLRALRAPDRLGEGDLVVSDASPRVDFGDGAHGGVRARTWQVAQPDEERLHRIDTAFAALSAAGILLSPLAWIHYVPVAAAPTLAMLARRRIWWGMSALIIAALPYRLLINRHYSALGTLTIGQWSFALAFLILMAAAVGRRSR